MSTIPYSQLEKGARIILNNQPCEIIEASSMFKGRGHSVLQAKLKNLITGEITSKTFHPSDSFEGADIQKVQVKFLYSHRGKFFFCEKNNPKKRFDLTENQIGSNVNFLKPEQIVEGIIFKDSPPHQTRTSPPGRAKKQSQSSLWCGGKVINISLPIKVRLKVAEAPPGVKGDRAQGGTKVVVLETGAEINVPLFIKEGDIVEINTEKGEYVRRTEKK